MSAEAIYRITCQDWDKLVQTTYDRPYKFQQQEGCQDRGIVEFVVPNEFNEEELPDSVSENDEDEEMGVKFQAWLDRDPAQPLKAQEYDWQLHSWWERNFYPDIQAVANDLHSKGLIEPGTYLIKIDW